MKCTCKLVRKEYRDSDTGEVTIIHPCPIHDNLIDPQVDQMIDDINRDQYRRQHPIYESWEWLADDIMREEWD